MAKYDYESENFYCSKISDNVRITRKVLLHHNGTGEVDARIAVEKDCSGKNNCGVGQRSGHGKNYDWTKCINPEFNKYLNIYGSFNQ